MLTSSSSEEARTYESLKADLLRSSPGKFAAVCGKRLLGVFSSIDDALTAASDAFDADTLPAGAPILITEIAERASVRVMATPQQKAKANRSPVSLRGML
ncbi:MAG TPA: hypothetical protein VFH68_08610 [Polyangia bacterium]|jgi:hypothetical protein|nr:hypothetical protein [Polyangia bacterium]